MGITSSIDVSLRRMTPAFFLILFLFHCVVFGNSMEKMVCAFSNSGKNIITKCTCSNCKSNPCQLNKHGSGEVLVSSSKFKGVVLLKNGEWGAQIYDNHRRIWLGTFIKEDVAAMAYDSVAIKLQRGDSDRNLPWTDLTIREPDFLDLYSLEDVVTMIKDGSYLPNFRDFLMCRSSIMADKMIKRRDQCRLLFDKALTPSDVGKLNRCVIPKYYAITYLPQIPEVNLRGIEDDDKVKTTQLTFFDRELKLWKFRYCYWKASRSFILTTGWRQFVKEKELKVNDTIVFYKCESKEEFKEKRTLYMIDVQYNNRIEGNVDVIAKEKVEGDFQCSSIGKGMEKDGKKRIKLFGVYIC